MKIKVNLSRGRIIRSRVEEDGSCTLFVDVEEIREKESQDIPNNVVLVQASKLSLKDAFMQYEPSSEREKQFKELLEKVIIRGIKDFWRPMFDPSFDDEHSICYVTGRKPAVGKSYNWWKKTAKLYNPKRRSRLGTKSEYVAFLGVLIKLLVSEGWTVAEAWNAVCNDSRQLGHYWNSKNAKRKFEATGSRKICGFFDLANTFKILAEDKEAGGFWLAGGYYFDDSNVNPLADLYRSNSQVNDNCYSVGWLVLEEGSTDH